MRKYGRTDANQREIVEACIALGASVCSLSNIGNGCPDLVVGYHGINYLLEVKDGCKPPSARKLTPDEAQFISLWRGKIHVVTCVGDVLALLIEEKF
jgi:hypothetical protein